MTSQVVSSRVGLLADVAHKETWGCGTAVAARRLTLRRQKVHLA